MVKDDVNKDNLVFQYIDSSKEVNNALFFNYLVQYFYYNLIN